MEFTQPCFIRKNTPELRKKLEELGYNRYPLWMADWSDDDPRYIYLVTDVLYYTYPQEPTKPKNGEYINCGENEMLFLSLAALRDDTDANQWFICDKEYITNNIVEAKVGEWIYIFEDDLEKLPGLNFYDYFHKATTKEIIDKFKSYTIKDKDFKLCEQLHISMQ